MSYLLGKPQFRYFLTYNSVRTEIVFSPASWEKNSRVSNTRNADYFGVFRSWALPLDFVLDGADILRQAYYNRSIQAGVKFEVEQLDVETLQYEIVFTGDVDFSGAKDNGTVFSATLMQSGSIADIMAYDDVKFEFPLTGPDVVNTILPGVAFDESSNGIFEPNFDNRRRFMPNSSVVGTAFQSGFVEVQSVEINSVNDDGFIDNPNWFVKANRAYDVKIKGFINVTFFQNVGGTKGFSFKIMDSTGATIHQEHDGDIAAGGKRFDFDLTVPMVQDQRLYFYLRTDGNTGPQWIRCNEGEYTVSYNAVSDPSDCKGILAFDFFKRMMARVSPGTTVESYLLKNYWKNLVFTSGDAIRQIENAKIKFSLKELYKTLNGIDDAGLGIENGATRLELASYFARMIQICDVGEVSKCEIRPATSYMMSKINIGYKDGNTDDKNGKQEYNSGQVWQSPITRVNTAEDWISPARADQFGIEKIRTEYNIKKEKKDYDTGSDNDTFIIDCFKDGENYRPVLGSSYQEVSGLTSPLTAYNLNLSPKHNLLRKGSFLHSIFNKTDNLFINFASGDKNTDLKTVKDSIVVKESQNIAISSLPPAYFIPHFAKISCKLPFNAQKLFKGREFGYITFHFEGCTLRGYIMDANIDIARNTEQEFELLLTADTDLVKWQSRMRNTFNLVP